MKPLPVVLIVITVLGLGPALGQSVGERTGINAALGVAPSTPDFVKQVAISDMFEIETSKLAESKAASAPIKNFASRMVKDHTKTLTELKEMVSEGGLQAQLPTALDSSHQSKLDRLNGLSGDDFAKAYNDAQRDGHEDAVSLFERYGKGGDNNTLKAWAERTLPDLREHLKMAKELKP